MLKLALQPRARRFLDAAPQSDLIEIIDIIGDLCRDPAVDEMTKFYADFGRPLVPRVCVSRKYWVVYQVEETTLVIFNIGYQPDVPSL